VLPIKTIKLHYSNVQEVGQDQDVIQAQPQSNNHINYHFINATFAATDYSSSFYLLNRFNFHMELNYAI
jgi:hypothetical protein